MYSDLFKIIWAAIFPRLEKYFGSKECQWNFVRDYSYAGYKPAFFVIIIQLDFNHTVVKIKTF